LPSRGWGARFNYPFLTQKERDNETGLDYFGARYYSSTQGRFTSPDEFSGGPTELFAEVAAHNPTFYADLANPQSLNKYQYALNNPLRFIAPDGHQETTSDQLQQNAAAVGNFAAQVAKDTVVGGGKGLANAVIDTSNLVNSVVDLVSPVKFGQMQRFEASTPGEQGAMIGVAVGLIMEGGVSASRAGTALVNSSRTAAMTSEMRATGSTAETIRATRPYERPTGATTAAQRASVQGKPCVTCGKVAERMFADHKTALVREHYLTGRVDRVRMRSLDAVQSQCSTCSGRQGAELGRWGRQMRAKLFE
jgi:RHS repeat-associated protein